MSNYIISCCSTADISKEHFERRNINYICFHFSLNGVEYSDDLGVSVPLKEFYSRMAKGEMTKTSQVSVGEFIAYFTEFLKQGKDILHICLSSGISGVYNSAVAAANILKEEYPERKIYIVDSLGASAGYGLFVDLLADKRDEGMTIDECHKFAEDNKLNVQSWFFSTDLKYYVRGGRITKAEGFFGSLLHICPLMNIDEDGKLIPREKFITVKKAEIGLVGKMKQYTINGADYDGKCFISHSDCLDYALAVKSLVEKEFPKTVGKIEISDIGTTIGSHTGPGTVTLFFMGKRRTN
ncbi:MAG: DegV family protein [Bacilli bacterium]